MARLTKLSRSIEGRVAIITGAASGMGRATAHLFADEGASVAITDVNAEGVQKVADEISAAGGKVKCWAVDVSSRDDVQRLVDDTVAAFGGVDILVNNAGIPARVAIDDEDYEAQWERCLAVDLTAMTYTVRAALPHLRKSDSARIVNIASTEGLGAAANLTPYNAAKAGVIGLTRGLAVELGKEGINVNCICPGPINTGMTERIAPEEKAIYARRRTALRRYGEPEEVAQMTLSLSLPAASFLTGAVIPVDGGLTIRRA